MNTKLQALKELGRRSFENFQRHILQTPEDFIRPHQRDWVESFEKYQNTMLLAPREHLKSSTLISYLLWKTLYNPEIRVLIVTINDSQASGILQQCRTIIETNPRIKEIFGEVRGEGGWSDNGLYFRRKSIYREPTIKASGIGSSTVGSRCDLLILDDLTDSDMADSPTKRAKLSERVFGELTSNVFDGGKIIILGTRKHAQDIYSEVLLNKTFFSIVQPAILSNLQDIEYEVEPDEAGVVSGPSCFKVKSEVEVFDPVRFPIERLLFLKYTKGTTKFLREYQNDISTQQDNPLEESWLVTEDAPPLRELDLYLGVDVALTEKQSSDYTVIVSLGVHRTTKKIYLLRKLHKRCSAPETIENIKREFQHWESKGFRPKRITIESNGGLMAVVQTIKQQTRLPVFPSHSRGNKIERFVGAVAPLFENGSIVLTPDFDRDEVFRIEWVNITNPKYHDDCLDAVEIALRPVLNKKGGKVRAYKYVA